MATAPNVAVCENCDNQMPAKAKHCPSCGAKKVKPFYKRAWFIILIIVVVAIGANTVLNKINSRIIWDDVELINVIPTPPSNIGKVSANSKEELRVSLENITDSRYNDYLDECVEKGFTVDAEKDSKSYKAYNADGYALDMSHTAGGLSIELEAPMALGTIAWPTGAAGSVLPAPKSTTGKFSFERDDSFSVYVGDTPRADYEEYVAACSDAGFTVDYRKNDTSYSADNADGWHVSLTYAGNSIMTVRVDAPKDEEPATAETKQVEPVATEAEPVEPAVVEAESTEPAASESKSSGLGAVIESVGSAVLDPDFKAAMDSYEAFMDEYVAFINRYNENPSDLGILTDYADYLNRYNEAMEAFDNWEDTDLNPAEAAYYLEVQARVSMKLADLAEIAW